MAAEIIIGERIEDDFGDEEEYAAEEEENNALLDDIRPSDPDN